MREEMYRTLGVDLTQIPCIGTSLAAVLGTEVGESLKQDFTSASAFSSWMGLCPAHDISGGKILSLVQERVAPRRLLSEDASQIRAAQRNHGSGSQTGPNRLPHGDDEAGVR